MTQVDLDAAQVDADKCRNRGELKDLPDREVVWRAWNLGDVTPKLIQECRDSRAKIAELDGMLEVAWGIIANAGGWTDPSVASPGWREAAERWRDQYHARLHERSVVDVDST